MATQSDQLSRDLASLAIDRSAPRASRGFGKVALVLALLAGGAAAYLAIAPRVESALFKTEVVVTEILSLSPQHAAVKFSSTGYVVPQVTSKVGARIQGRVAAVHVREGSRVKAGDELVVLDDADVTSTIESAKLRITVSRARALAARANVVEIEQQFARESRLADQQIASASTVADLRARVDVLKAQVKTADAEIKVAEAELATLQVNKGHTVIRAPISGVVIGKPIEVGALVGNLGGGPVVELADFASLVVETDVPEARLHMLVIGEPAEIVLDAFPDRRLEGKVVEVSPKVNRAKATAMVKVGFSTEPADVLPDMAARVGFLRPDSAKIDAQAKPKVVVPAEAVTDRNGTKVVFVIDGDTVRITQVTLGEPFANGFELTQGPAAGTKVVRNPPPALVDGQAIKEKIES